MGLGAAYLHGNQGAEKDLAKAKQFLQKSCDLGTKSACEKVKELK
jgi:TPR repeat protein